MKNQIPAVAKAVALMLRLADRRQRLTQSEIARTFKLSASTAYRLAQTLASAGWIERDANLRWGASSGLLPLAHAMRNETRVFENARAILRALAYERGIACKLTIRNGAMTTNVIYEARPGDELLGEIELSACSLVEGPTGAALLCDKPKAELLRLAAECPVDIPEKLKPKILLTGVDAIRRKGWHHKVCDKPKPVVTVMAAPVRAMNGAVVAALTFMGSGPAFAPKKYHDLSRLLLLAADACSSTDAWPLHNTTKLR